MNRNPTGYSYRHEAVYFLSDINARSFIQITIKQEAPPPRAPCPSSVWRVGSGAGRTVGSGGPREAATARSSHFIHRSCDCTCTLYHVNFLFTPTWSMMRTLFRNGHATQPTPHGTPRRAIRFLIPHAPNQSGSIIHQVLCLATRSRALSSLVSRQTRDIRFQSSRPHLMPYHVLHHEPCAWHSRSAQLLETAGRPVSTCIAIVCERLTLCGSTGEGWLEHAIRAPPRSTC